MITTFSFFFCVLPFEVHVKVGFKLDDRLDVSSFINSKTIGGIGSLGTGDVGGGRGGGELDVLVITLYHLLKTFCVACPFVTFNCAKMFSLCNTTFLVPFSLDVPIFTSFKISQS
jgi:hypothetical protein